MPDGPFDGATGALDADARRAGRAAWWVGGGAIAFGAVTLVAGTRALVLRERAGLEGPILTPLVAFNVVAAVGYVVAGVGVARRRRWSGRAAAAIAIATGLAFLALAAYVGRGGAVAERTVVALTLRVAFWTSLAFWCRAERVG